MTSQPPPRNGPANVVALDTLLMKRGPGRPRKIQLAPSDAERARRECLRARLQEHIAADSIVAVTSKPADRSSTATIDATMRELAAECGGLAWTRERAQVEGRGEEAERTASRRIAGLSRIADLALERARLGESHFDPHDPRVQRIVQAFVDGIREAAEETLDSDSVKRFLENFSARIEGWEAKVE